MLRVLSGLLLIALVGATMWLLPAWAMVLLAAFSAALAGGELAHMSLKLGAPASAPFIGLAAAAITVAFVLHQQPWMGPNIDSLEVVLLALVLATGVTAIGAAPPSPASFLRVAVGLMAPLYIGLPCGALGWIHSAAGPAATTWLIGTIAVSDSAQYYAGRTFGRRKLAPAVSPAKTVEGAIGGLVAVAVTGAVFGPLALPGSSAVACAGLALVLAVFGMAGDLFESLLKRSAGVKDSSALIPGHGGVLDRIDSYLFAAPVFYVFLRHVR